MFPVNDSHLLKYVVHLCTIVFFKDQIVFCFNNNWALEFVFSIT